MNDQLYDILLRSFDIPLDERGQVKLQQALADPEIRAEHDRLRTMRSLINQSARSAFEPFFVQRLLQRLVSAQEEFRRWLLWDFQRVALAGMVAAVLLAYYNVSRRDSVNIAAAFAEREYTFEQVLRLEVPYQ